MDRPLTTATTASTEKTAAAVTAGSAHSVGLAERLTRRTAGCLRVCPHRFSDWTQAPPSAVC